VGLIRCLNEPYVVYVLYHFHQFVHREELNLFDPSFIVQEFVKLLRKPSRRPV